MRTATLSSSDKLSHSSANDGEVKVEAEQWSLQAEMWTATFELVETSKSLTNLETFESP